MRKLIHPDKLGYIKDYYICQNVRTIEDILIYAKEYNIPRLLVLKDSQKVFDMVQWTFLFDFLKQFDFHMQCQGTSWVNPVGAPPRVGRVELFSFTSEIGVPV